MSAGRALLRLRRRNIAVHRQESVQRRYPLLCCVSAFHAAALSVILLSGCETFIPPPPQIVSVPVPVSCLPTTLPQRPKIATDAELSAIDDYQFTLQIFIDRRRLLDYSGELEAVLLACK